jgi:hypothetical protein
MKRDFEQERSQARPIAERLSTWLQELGIAHDDIDWQRAGMLAEVKTGEIRFGSMISLQSATRETLLEEVRYSMAREIAYDSLSMKRGNHILGLTNLTLDKGDISWLIECTFDQDESRYVLIAEHLQPAETPSGLQRIYRLYQAKPSRQCDMPQCIMNWHVRKITTDHVCIHLCMQHQALDPNQILSLVKPQLVLGEGNEL